MKRLGPLLLLLIIIVVAYLLLTGQLTQVVNGLTNTSKGVHVTAPDLKGVQSATQKLAPAANIVWNESLTLLGTLLVTTFLASLVVSYVAGLLFFGRARVGKHHKVIKWLFFILWITLMLTTTGLWEPLFSALPKLVK